MVKRNATRDDVIQAIKAQRLRVDIVAGFAETRRCGQRAVWHPAHIEIVKGPHQKLGYARISFAGFRALLHRVVWWAAGREIPDGLEVNHKNGQKMDCAITNLEVTTRSGNMRHGHAQGLFPKPMSTALFSDVEVRALRASGESRHELARRHGTDASTISKIVRGITYSHVR
jgi:hypothetical protein